MPACQVVQRPLSFSSAKGLRDLVETLPKPPPWKSRVVKIPGGKTKKPLTLLYRDGLECFRFLFGNPVYSGHMEFHPRRTWSSDSKQERLYSEIMTGDLPWRIQVSLSDFFPGIYIYRILGIGRRRRDTGPGTPRF